jgi:hypothetical protein
MSDRENQDDGSEADEDGGSVPKAKASTKRVKRITSEDDSDGEGTDEDSSAKKRTDAKPTKPKSKSKTHAATKEEIRKAKKLAEQNEDMQTGKYWGHACKVCHQPVTGYNRKSKVPHLCPKTQCAGLEHCPHPWPQAVAGSLVRL